MQLDKETEKLMQELQILEQNLQHLLMEKQSLEAELNEFSNALEEVKKTQEDTYRILGNVMLKVNKASLIKELEEKNKLSELRIKSVENQEKAFQTKIDNLRKDITKVISDKKIS